MRKLASLVLCVVLIALSLGAAVVPASGAAVSSALSPTLAPATISSATHQVFHVWPVVFTQTNTGSVRRTQPGYDETNSVELSLPAVFDQAEAGVLIAPVVFGDIDASDPLQANFKGYLNPSNNSEAPAPIYMNLYCDMTADGTADYTLRSEMITATPGAGQWDNYSAVSNTWQISSDNNPHGISTGSSATWQQLKADNFTSDRILGVSVFSYRGTGRSALGLNIDGITLGSTVYDLRQIQDAICSANPGDVVVVHPGTSPGPQKAPYVYPEFLSIDKSITVESYAEYMNIAPTTDLKPVIQPARIPVTADNLTEDFAQVVLITASNVVFQGFTVKIDGYLDEGQTIPDTGIIAVDSLDLHPAADLPLSNVIINDNTVNIDNITNAWGIEVIGYEGLTEISGNALKIGSLRAGLIDEGDVHNGSGIEVRQCQNVSAVYNSIDAILYGSLDSGLWAVDCGTVEASHNTLNMQVDCANFNGQYDGLEGLFFERVSNVSSNYNKVNLTGAGNYGYIEGIGLWNSDNSTFLFDRAVIVQNQVKLNFSNLPPEQAGELVLQDPDTELYGIWAERGRQLRVEGNTIGITSDNQGQAFMDGVTLAAITQTASVTDNSVTLYGQVRDRDVQVSGLAEPGKHRSTVSAQIDDNDLFGLNDMEFNTSAEAYGLSIYNSNSPLVSNNTIDVKTKVKTTPNILASEDQLDNVTAGLSYAVALDSIGNSSPQIIDNDFGVVTDLKSGLDNLTGDSFIANRSFSIALGVNLGAPTGSLSSDGMITGNQIKAVAKGQGGTLGSLIINTQNLVMDDLQFGILDDLDTVIDEAIARATQTAAQNAAQTLTTNSVAEFEVIGLGILAFNAPGLTIQKNDPVSGVAQGMVNSISMDNYTVSDQVFADGMAYGLGGGILLVQCDRANVIDNGQGAADEVEAANVAAAADQTDSSVMQLPDYTIPPSGVVGLAVLETDVIPGALSLLDTISISSGETLCNSFGILAIKDSSLTAGDPLSVSISGNYVLTGSWAQTLAVALAGPDDSRVISQGISAGYSLGIASTLDASRISGNQVWIDKQSTMESGAIGGPGKMIGALGESINRSAGIFVRGNGANQILDNRVLLSSVSTVNVIALELPIFLDIQAISLNRSAGIGVAVFGNGVQTISGNQARVRGNCQVEVNSGTFESLDQSQMLEIGIGFNAGLLLAGGQGSQAANTVTRNQFGSSGRMSINLSGEGDFIRLSLTAISLNIDALILGGKTDFTYNDLIGRSRTQAEVVGVNLRTVDCGLLNLGGQVNAHYNYWGDPTGPAVLGQGFGRGIVQKGTEEQPADTTYTWWLSNSITDLEKDNIGYYGFAQSLQTGWNTLSVPMSLEHSRWSDIVDMSHLDYEIAYTYDPTKENPWQQILVDDPETEINESSIITPLDGIYIKMKTPGMVFFTSGTSMGLPARSLTKGQSWYLVGATPYDDTYPYTTRMSVADAFNTLLLTPDGLPGMTGVVSPAIGGQDPWYWTTNNTSNRMVQTGKAYWVFMKNPGALYGFISTPLPAFWPAEQPK